VRLVIQDAMGPIAEIDDFKGSVPRIGETVYVPVDDEQFSAPRIVIDVQHDFLAPATRTRPGWSSWTSKTPTVTVLL
jgi:hypothetical protein